jgi:hypothetical protein
MKRMSNQDIYGTPIFTYTDGEGVEDGILARNPASNKFSECSLITSNLWETVSDKCVKGENHTIEFLQRMGEIMQVARDYYHSGKWKGDHDRDFFTIEAQGLKIWFARNGQDKLTAMLPEDY